MRRANSDRTQRQKVSLTMIQRKQSSRNNLSKNSTKTLVNIKRSSSSGRKTVDENVSRLYYK